MSPPTDLLLDTQAFLWMTHAPELLSPRADAAMRAADALYLSAASVYEVSNKYRLGKLPMVAPLIAEGWAKALHETGVGVLPVTLDDAEYAGLYRQTPHRDPWDRIIAAQGILRALPVVSSDAALDAFDVARVW